jgi:hypothetical protein
MDDAVYSSLLGQYDMKAGMEEFDQLRHLLFMENVTPLAIDHLIRIAPQWEDHQELTIALLKFLNRSCRFNFMLQTFEGQF